MNYTILLKYEILLLVMIFIQGCDQKVSDQMLTTLDNFGSKSCVFEMAKITDFEWDQLYVFDEYADEEYISRVTGIEWSVEIVPDSYKRLFFVEKDNLVYLEDYSPYKVNIQFRPMDWMNDEVAKYTKNQAIFKVLKKETRPNSEVFFYDLYPLKGTLQPDE